MDRGGGRGRAAGIGCTELLGAGPVHYYVEARDSRDQVVATSGEPASPHVLMVLAELRMLAGLPHFATMFDLGTGIAVAF